MRSSGVLASVNGLGLHDHVCLPFSGESERRTATIKFFADGRRLGQRLLYLGSGPEERLRDDLSGLPGAGRLFRDGALQIRSVDGVYEVGRPVDAEEQLRTFARETEQALSEGYTGLRVVGQPTDLVTDPEVWEAWLRWEAVADRYMASMPLAAMCCFDRRVLPKQFVADVARIHPAVRDTGGVSEFQLFSGRERNTMMLYGDVDYFCTDDLDRLLTIAAPECDRPVLDMAELKFIDQYGVKLLADRAGEANGRSLRIRNLPDHARRLCDLMGVEL